MRNSLIRSATVWLFSLLMATAYSRAATPLVLLHSLFDPGTNAQSGVQQGYRVAADGNLVVAGALNSGAVKVYDALTGQLLHALPNPSPGTPDGFGVEVAISGTRVVVGAIWNNTGGPGAGVAHVFDLAGGTPTIPLVTLTNPNPATSYGFGDSVAISGSRLVVGSYGENGGAMATGAAYVFDLTSATPTVPAAILNHPTPASGDLFGSAVALSGTRLVAGAPQDNTGATQTGSAYVYDLAGAAPAEPLLHLADPNPNVGNHFGATIGISGTRAVVGAPWDDTGTNDTGSAYVYDLAGASPSQPVCILTNPIPRYARNFAIATAISGERVVIGAPFDGPGAYSAGKAYIYDLANSTPAIPALTLTNPVPSQRDLFGYALAISGPRLVVGTPTYDAGTLGPGIAYVYDLTNTLPSSPAVTLTNPSPMMNELFGAVVSISGPWVAVSAGTDDAKTPGGGRVHVFNLGGAAPTTPTITITITNPEPTGLSAFGASVAISGSRILVGSRGANIDATTPGRAYVYDLARDAPMIPVAELTAPRAAADDGFGFSATMADGMIAIGAPFDDTAASDRGATYVFGVPPSLSIISAAPGFVRLSWTPSTSSGFKLQSSDSLMPPKWVAAPSGATNPVTIPAGTTPRIYRLAQP